MYGIPHLKFKKDIWFLLGSILIIHIAAYLIVPIFPILLRNQKGLNPTQVGLIIGAGSLFIQLGSIIAGFISSRFGNKLTMVIGNACQAIALFGLGSVHTLYPLILFSALNGIGTGIYVPTVKSAISYIASEENRTTAFSMRGVAAHAGTSVAGLFVLFSAANQNFYIASGIYIALMIVSWIYLPANCGEEPCPPLPFNRYIQIFKNKTFMIFTFVSIFLWALHTQLNFLLPLRGEAILNNTNIIGTIWTITSVTVIFIQPFISRMFLSKLSPRLSICIGSILVGVGVTLIGWANSFYFLILCAIIFILGEMFMMPTLDSVTSFIADPNMIGAYFGVASFASGVGAALGAFSSGRLIDLYGITESYLPWIVYGVATLMISGLIYLPAINTLDENNQGPG